MRKRFWVITLALALGTYACSDPQKIYRQNTEMRLAKQYSHKIVIKSTESALPEGVYFANKSVIEGSYLILDDGAALYPKMEGLDWGIRTFRKELIPIKRHLEIVVFFKGSTQ